MEPKTIAELVELLGADQETAYKAYESLRVTATRASAPGNDAERARVAAELAGTLTGQLEEMKKNRGSNREMFVAAAVSQKCNKTIRLLSYVGGAAEVPVLAQALENFDTREMARFALEHNPSPEVTAELVKAVDAVGSRFRIGVLGALGKRDCPKAMAAVKQAAGDPDRDVAMAAVEVLPRFARPCGDEAIAKAMKCGCPKTVARAARARLRLAENLCEKGDKAGAKKILKAVAGSKVPEAQVKAARKALAEL